MCQDLPLGCLNCLFGVCCEKIETFAVVLEFLKVTGTCKNSEIFTHYFYANFLFFPNCSEFFELLKYSDQTDLYRLSCFS